MDLATDDSTETTSVASAEPILVPAEASTAQTTPMAAPAAMPEPIVVAKPAPVVTEAPAAPAAPAAPMPIPAPVAAAVVEPVDPAKLNQVLDAAGLQWVQTDPTKAPAEAVAEPAPQLGRKPKRSQQVTEAEPLVMVETRSSEQPPAS